MSKLKKIFYKLSRKFQKSPPEPKPFKESPIAHRYLDGLNGVEIGGNAQNSFGLEKTGGAYANIDFDVSQSTKWQSEGFPQKPVNIVALGDDLPFKDNSLDYVISSHVLEHFFDPIKTINEWFRVIRPGGFIFMIIPHKDRTYDRLRPVTEVEELIDRNSGKLKPEDYIIMTIPELSTENLPPDYMKLFKGDRIPEGFIRLTADSHRHQTVWNFHNMIDLCKKANFNVVYANETDDKVGSGFTVILQK